MCWNAEVSLNTFLFAMFGAVFGYVNGFNRKLLLFFTLFSFMQFIEYMLWSNLDNKEINRLWSIIGLLFIYILPFASINILDPSKVKTILFTVYSISVLIHIFSFKHDFITTVGKNGHLEWNWLIRLNSIPEIIISVIWFGALFIPFIIKSLQNKKYIAPLIIILFTTILTGYNYFMKKSFGTMWCWVSNAIWLYVIYVSIRKTHF